MPVPLPTSGKVPNLRVMRYSRCGRDSQMKLMRKPRCEYRGQSEVRGGWRTGALMIFALSLLGCDGGTAWHCTEGTDLVVGVRTCHSSADYCEEALASTAATRCAEQESAWCMERNSFLGGRAPVCFPSVTECEHNRQQVGSTWNPSACYPKSAEGDLAEFMRGSLPR